MIAVDWDGTLVEYHGWKGPGVFGPPVPAMVQRVKDWLAEGKEVCIFTSRVSIDHSIEVAVSESIAIQKALMEMDLPALEVTANKSIKIKEFWDDRAVRVEKNKGERCCGE